MRIYPTRTAAHVAITGVVVMGAGIALREAAVVAWGGALLVGVVFARAVTLVSVMRIRAAGFEMLWTGTGRAKRTHYGGTVVLEAEVRNRDTLSARYDKLRVVASPALQTWVEPVAGEVRATGSVRLRVFVRALRVGYHGIYGLALEVRGAPGMFEVPLTFANPYGIEVMPRALRRLAAMPHGGRSRTAAHAGASGTKRGDGTEVRELREHVPGDPFRRIAWKASARRGKLVVREFEREERDVVLIVLDASVELWSGPIGGAPLDLAIEQVATLAGSHLGRGDLVGLRVVGARELAVVDPDHGRPQLGKICGTLMEHTGVLSADRSGWDESDFAVQVTEHMRPLDSRAPSELRRGRIDRLVGRARALGSHAPFARPAPLGRNESDSELRRYAACFGLFVPPRLEPDRDHAAAALGRVIAAAAVAKRPRSTVVHVVAPPPPAPGEGMLRAATRRLRSRHIRLRWTVPPFEAGLEPFADEAAVPFDLDAGDRPRPEHAPPDPLLFAAVRDAVAVRALVATRHGEQLLRRLGAEIVRIDRPASLPSAETSERPDEVA